MPEDVGSIVAVFPGSLLLVFSGFCVTVHIAPTFAVAPDCSSCMTSKFIVLSSNDSVIYCNLMRSISSARQGFGGFGGRGVVGWG